jgi:site-specific recombinase XerC
MKKWGAGSPAATTRTCRSSRLLQVPVPSRVSCRATRRWRSSAPRPAASIAPRSRRSSAARSSPPRRLRDRIALRLLLDYALRKGSLKAVQFKHFDHARKRLTIFAKGGKVRNLPIPDPAFWHDLERLILDTEAQPQWFLLPTTAATSTGRCSSTTSPRATTGCTSGGIAASVVPGRGAGADQGEHMHKARHSAGQRLLDHTGNLKAVQQLLGHASIATTGDVYVDWSEQQLSESLASMIDHDQSAD